MAAASETASDAAGRAALTAALRHDLVVDDARTHRCTHGTHSRVADGRIVCWSPPNVPGMRCAIDAEIVGQPVPSHLGRRWRGRWAGHESFWDAWCATEVCAKLLDIPILVLAAAGPVGSSPVTVGECEVTYAVGRHLDLVVAFGVGRGAATVR